MDLMTGIRSNDVTDLTPDSNNFMLVIQTIALQHLYLVCFNPVKFCNVQMESKILFYMVYTIDQNMLIVYY